MLQSWHAPGMSSPLELLLSLTPRRSLTSCTAGALTPLPHCSRFDIPEEQVADAVDTALQLVNMRDFKHRATHTLSGGQRQRVAIAGVCCCSTCTHACAEGHILLLVCYFWHCVTILCPRLSLPPGALAEDPRLLLLDELTTFLDVEDQFGVLQAVRAITRQRRDVTAVWVTHRFEELEYADAASYMENGQVVFTGSPEQMRERLRAMGAALR